MADESLADDRYDVVVIGSGPGGYIAAIRAAQLGLSVACIDEHAELGGTCLRVGCIPSKALLESSAKVYDARHGFAEHGLKAQVEVDLAAMMKRKDKVVKTLTGGVRSQIKKNKNVPIQGRGRITGAGKVTVDSSDSKEPKDKKTGTRELTAERILLAPGTRPAPLPGVELDGERIGTSTEALAYSKAPGRLVVIGAGYIGLELGSVWQRLGSQVTVLEYLDRILPGMDTEIASAAAKAFTQQGIEIQLGRRVTAARRKGKNCVVESEGHDPITCDAVLLAVGRVPATDDLGLETVGIELDKRSFIPVDDAYQTSAPGVFAIGDAIGGAQLAHKAEEEGVACAELWVTGHGHVNYDAIPGVVYTDPEVASVGKTEEQLIEAGTEYRKGVFPHRANGRARAMGRVDGMTKMLVDAKTDRILGVHIIGPHAGDLIAEAVAAIEFGASAEDLYRTSHAHPTLAETLKEAALASAGRTLNL